MGEPTVRRVLIVSIKNEISGSCVMAQRMQRFLARHPFRVDVLTSAGDFFSDAVCELKKTNLNPFLIISNVWALHRFLGKKTYDLILFNTIFCLPLLLLVFGRKKILLLHEYGLKPKFLSRFADVVINLFRVRVGVVNPAFSKLYKKSLFIPNFYDAKVRRFRASDKSTFRKILMIANLKISKGFFDFVELARANPQYSFNLLTNLAIAEKKCVEYVKSGKVPANLDIVTNQKQKKRLLADAKYLLFLSHLDESFGLVLLEAVFNGTIPLAYKNPGSRYVLNGDSDLMLDQAQPVESFRRHDELLSGCYQQKMVELYEYVNLNFSGLNFFKNFVRLFNESQT